jgi:broad specificity phosphatase PhoE
MSAIVALMRHGEAVPGATAAERPLTALGRLQAAAAGRWLATLGIARAFATDTPRARETAALVAPGLEVGPAPELEGLRIGGPEVALHGVGSLGIPFEDPTRRPAGGESLVDLQERSRAGLARIAAADPRPALLVAHRFTDCVLVAAGLGVELGRAEALLQDPGAVNIWSVGAEQRLLAVNVTPADPLRTEPPGLVLPDTPTAVERRRYLVAVAPGAEARAPELLGAAVEGEAGPEASVEMLPAAEVAAALVAAAGLGEGVAERIPAPPGSVAILDHAAGRWWLRCLGWTPLPPLGF